MLPAHQLHLSPRARPDLPFLKAGKKCAIRKLPLPPPAAASNNPVQTTEGSSTQGRNISLLGLRRQTVIKEVITEVHRMGEYAVLPGNQEEKAPIDKKLRLLESLQPQDNAQINGRPVQVRSRPSIVDDPRLLGTWDLLYASDGTAVTRTAAVQALVAASQLPNVGVTDIKQNLTTDKDGFIQASNEAEFGLGPFGTWSIALLGQWLPGGSTMGGEEAPLGQVVKVVFEQLKVKPAGLMGCALPDWLPEAALSLGAASMERRGAEWFTTFLDDDFRIGRGRSGNTFFFRKRR